MTPPAAADASLPPRASSATSAAPSSPAMGRRRRLRREMEDAQVHVWYPRFQGVTIRARFVPLPPAFVQYLQEDGIVLPTTAQTLSALGSEGEEEADGGGDGDGGVSFPEVEAAIEAAIRELGGEVCPKLNWTVPRDAAWVNGGTLKCQTVADVILLLKSSHLLQHDLSLLLPTAAHDGEHEEEGPPRQVMLCLRRWCRFHPSMHFRVFVAHRTIAGMCQRDVSRAYPFLSSDLLPRLARLLTAFTTTTVLPLYPHPHVVVDVYVDKSDRAWLVDLNDYHQASGTDALLFDWNSLPSTTATPQQQPTTAIPPTGDPEEEEDVEVEVEEEEEKEEGGGGGVRVFRVSYRPAGRGQEASFQFRVVGDERVTSDPMSAYRVPIDMVGGLVPGDLEQLQRLCRRPGEEESSSDEEEKEQG